MILSLVTFIPAVGAVLIALLPRGRAVVLKGVALAVSVVTFLVSLPLWTRFDASSADYQFVEQRAWMPSLGISYHLGIDGISLLLVLLTTFLVPLVLLSAWDAIESRLKEFVIVMLLLETGMLGVFVSLDLFLFYIFWEAMLIPMYFLIGIWGHERRIYAAVKFFLYTFAGSVLMLVAFLVLYRASGLSTFDIPALATAPVAPALQTWLFAACALAFASPCAAPSSYTCLATTGPYSKCCRPGKSP
jgi:NADH-quinone oxidoreductase subunit M